MKSYIQGLITGGVFVFAVMVLMGSTDTKSKVGRYQMLIDSKNRPYLFDTQSGEYYKKKADEFSRRKIISTGVWNLKPAVSAYGVIKEKK